MSNRTYLESALCLFGFLCFCLAMMAERTPQVVAFALLTCCLIAWLPLRKGPMNRATRAVSTALALAAVLRVALHLLPNPSL
ncbi:MAG: hypothetical protein GAK31_01805 [Stenotrophomonas maltophilia]|uniref:Transmembrane protein n=1 Tax=Stenotrophomonas maltophilia TaxID=40324 RepID=A0A7V8FIE2_STEMA|nr:MAG: hypothetical protein GAK31_01805 [Stenotrophomonas maltophilia]